MNAYERIVLNLTNKCNTVCRYCFQDSRLNKNQFLPIETIKKCLDWCAARAEGKAIVQFTGGEPTLHPDFWEAFGYAKRKGFLIKLQTNGLTLKRMSKDQLHLLAQNGVAVKISLDGYDSKTHERMRAKGSFEEIIAGVEALIPYKPRFAFKSVLSQEVAREFQRMLDLSLSFGAVGVSYNLLRSEGRAKDLKNEIDELEFSSLAIELFNQNRYRHLLNGTRILEIWMKPQKCFLEKSFYVYCDGSVYPSQKCDSEECLGNINSDIECLNEDKLKAVAWEVPIELYQFVKEKLKI